MTFDWTRILKGEPTQQEARPRQEPQERRPRPQRQRAAAPAAPSVPAAQPESPPLPPAIQPQAVEPAHAAAEPVSIAPVPAFDEDGTPTDAMAGERTVDAETSETATAAMTRLGAEGLLRLRARHAEVLARISEKVPDPLRRDELKLQAERLNPDTWVTDSEVTAGLEQYEAVFESLRSVVGRRRKRRRRRSSGPAAAAAATGDAAVDQGDAAVDQDEAGDDDGTVEDL